jgi:hypothetical protein
MFVARAWSFQVPSTRLAARGEYRGSEFVHPGWWREPRQWFAARSGYSRQIASPRASAAALRIAEMLDL